MQGAGSRVASHSPWHNITCGRMRFLRRCVPQITYSRKVISARSESTRCYIETLMVPSEFVRCRISTPDGRWADLALVYGDGSLRARVASGFMDQQPIHEYERCSKKAESSQHRQTRLEIVLAIICRRSAFQLPVQIKKQANSVFQNSLNFAKNLQWSWKIGIVKKLSPFGFATCFNKQDHLRVHIVPVLDSRCS